MAPHKSPPHHFTRIAETLRDFYLRSHRALDRMMAAEGASFARAKMLMHIARDQPVRSTDLAAFFGYAPRTITEAIDNLERDGLVTREGDPEDRRVKRITLTDAGATVAQAADATRVRYLEAVFSTLNEREYEELIRLLGKLNTRLEDMEREEADRA